MRSRSEAKASPGAVSGRKPPRAKAARTRQSPQSRRTPRTPAPGGDPGDRPTRLRELWDRIRDSPWLRSAPLREQPPRDRPPRDQPADDQRPNRPTVWAGLPWRRIARELGWGLVTVGVAILLFVGYELWGTDITEAHAQSSLAQSFRAAVHASAGPAPTPTTTVARGPTGGNGGGSGSGDQPTVSAPGAPAAGAAGAAAASAAEGQAVDHLVIPQAGVNKYVVEGVGESDLRKGPGHYPQSVLPGQRGNAAIAGHRTTYGAPFYHLGNLRPGDPIYVTDLRGRTFVYRVDRTEVVNPDDVSVLDPTPDAELTLTTCNPPYSAATRMVVVARLVGEPTATPTATTVPGSGAGQPGTAPPTTSAAAAAADSTLGQGRGSAGGPMVGYGLLAVAFWAVVRVGASRVRRRSHQAGVIVAGALVCLVPLWFCFENVVLLLPQNI